VHARGARPGAHGQADRAAALSRSCSQSYRNHTIGWQAIGRTLPDVEVTTTWGQPTLKVRGRMLACMASHKSAEPDTLVVMMDFADRDALVEDDPGTYYLKEHSSAPCAPQCGYIPPPFDTCHIPRPVSGKGLT